MSHGRNHHTGTEAMSAARLLVACCCLLLSALARAETLLVVIPEPSTLTEEFIQDLRELRSEDEVLVHDLSAPSAVPSASMLITMGSNSLQWRLGQNIDTPTIATYVNSSAVVDLQLADTPDAMQILLANPAPARQLRLAQLLIPKARDIGALFTPEYASQLPAWQLASASLGLNLVTLPLASQDRLGRQMIDLLDRSDVLIAFDDPAIYNADNLKTILLSSYTRNKVLIGPSAPFINAGSLSTTYSTPEQMAQSTHALLNMPWRAGQTSYPRYFSVLSNAQVARSLGFPPPDDEALVERLRQQEVGQ